jgi:hypothetical protein
VPASLPQGCPDEDTLLAFAEGQLVGEGLDAVVRHLESCDRCLGALGTSEKGYSSSAGRSSTAFRPGDLVAGRYEIRRFVARGGMGEVYEAHDRLVGARVALKTVLLASADDPRAVELMRREVRIARAITHPGICRVFDLGEHEFPATGVPASRLLFLTMEFLDGTTLGDQIRSTGALPFGTLMPIARQLAAALAAAHDAGIVHRDLKSDNVMWLSSSSPDSAPKVVVMDFGLARPAPGMSGVHSTGGMVVGSVGYMAPEQVEGTPVTAAADIYAFGVVLFEAVTARLPFVASTPMATALKRLREPAPAPSTVAAGVHAGLEAIIMRCLARRPADRFASMRDVAVALDAIDRTVAMPRPLPRGARVVWLGLGVAGAVGALAGSLILLREPTPAGRPSSPMNLPASDVVRAPAPAAATGTPAPAPTVLSSPAAAAAPVADAGAALTEKPQVVPRRTRRTPAAPARAGKEPPVEKPRAEPVRPAQNGRSTSPLDGFADPYR